MNILRSIKEQLSYMYRTKYPAKIMVKDSLIAGFTDVNDFIEYGKEGMAKNAMQKLFSYDYIARSSGSILEVGSGTGRFTREILKYVSSKVAVVCLEYSADYCRFLSNYAKEQSWSQVSVIQGDIFKTSLQSHSFGLIIIPWFIQPLSLYKYGQLFKESERILKKNGYLVFDFMDSQDKLLDVIEEASNSPYFLLNGKDLEKIAIHFGFTKKAEFKEKFNKQIGKYHIYQKR